MLYINNEKIRGNLKEMIKKSLKQQILVQILRCRKCNVFTRKDFKILGDYDQVGMALLILTRKKVSFVLVMVYTQKLVLMGLLKYLSMLK